MNLAEFIHSSARNAHIKHPLFKSLYVRKSKRLLFKPGLQECFDIAAMGAKEKGTKALPQLIEEIWEELPDTTIFVENVLYKEVGDYLMRLGFKKCRSSSDREELLPSYYLIPANSELDTLTPEDYAKYLEDKMPEPSTEKLPCGAYRHTYKFFVGAK